MACASRPTPLPRAGLRSFVTTSQRMSRTASTPGGGALDSHRAPPRLGCFLWMKLEPVWQVLLGWTQLSGGRLHPTSKTGKGCCLTNTPHVLLAAITPTQTMSFSGSGTWSKKCRHRSDGSSYYSAPAARGCRMEALPSWYDALPA